MKLSRQRYSDLEALFLMRLFRLARMRARFERADSAASAKRRLIDEALNSTLQDCEALGLRGEAHAVLESDERAVDS